MPTSPRRALLRAAPAALLLFSFTACIDDSVPTRPTVEPPVHAVLASVAPLVVNTLADHDDGSCDDIGDGTDCTLREAVVYAESGATITFAEGVTGTIELTGELQLNVDVSIVGPGADVLILDANGSDASPHRALAVNSTVVISGLTVTGGWEVEGGGIVNNAAGTLTLSNMVVAGNISDGDGGGISNSGTLTVQYSTVSSNTGADGGGIHNKGTLVVDHSTISDNTTGWGGVGGGIWASGTAITTTVLNSTISGNTAGCRGGGIDNMKLIRIGHSTITANTTTTPVTTFCMGGGLQSFTNGENGAEMVGTIIWGNFAGGAAEDVADQMNAGPFTSLGHNLIGTAGTGVDFALDFTATGDLTGVDDALLGALALNDPGTTATHALLEGSPAIDAGVCTDADGNTVETDQRDVSRPQGATCDIGAYEAESGGGPTTLVVNSLNDPGSGGCDETECTLREAVETPGSSVTITFSPGLTGTITLTSALQLNFNVSVVGPGAENVTVNANGSSGSPSRGLVVYSTAAISGLTVTGGYASTGAGIWNAGTLTLSRMVVTGNIGDDGAGIYNSGTLTVSQSTVSDNTGTRGGGIENEGALVVDHSTISGNTASLSYGMGGLGGGIHASPGAVTTTVRNSTISGNMAACRGGGIDNMKMVRIEHTTITANTTANVSSYCMGGGLQSYTDAANGEGAEIVGSLIWGNLAGGVAEDVADQSDVATFNSLGHNLIGAAGYGVDFSGDFTATGDQTGVPATEAVLEALALNDPGTTATHALADGSPAIDAGTCTGLDGATVADDQRGVTRPQGSACDIGAYEGGTAAPPPSFTSACSYTVHPKNGSYITTVSWSNAEPGVTKIEVTDGRTLTKQMAPTATGSWSTTVRSGVPSYQLWGGTSRKDAGTELQTKAVCQPEAGG